MITRQIAYQILFWTFATIILGHVFCPVLKLDQHWVHWITLTSALVGLVVVVWLRGWIHATEVDCPIDSVLSKLLVVRLNPARIALLDDSWRIVECSNPFATAVGAVSSFDLVGRDARDFLQDSPDSVNPIKQAINDQRKRPISFIGLDTEQRQAFIQVSKINDEYMVCLEPMRG